MQIKTSSDVTVYENTDCHPSIDPVSGEQFTREQANKHIVGLCGNKIMARCSLWMKNIPVFENEQLLVLGHYASADFSSGKQFLKKVAENIDPKEHSFVIGPMDGNTWRKYRLQSWSGPGNQAPFFMEPENPMPYPHEFTVAGFAPVSEYFSARTHNLDYLDPRLEKVGSRMTARGISIRFLDKNHYERDLRLIFRLSLVSFRSNFLYTPIGENDFLQLYLPLRDHVVPDLVLLAENERGPVGYIFSIPDYAQVKTGLEKPDQIIVKTVAVLPERRYAGLGNLLVQRTHDNARKLGFHRAIHALMQESNVSRNLSAHYTETFRRYTLFGKRIRPDRDS